MYFEGPPSLETIDSPENRFEGVKHVTIVPEIDEDTGKYILFHGSPRGNIESFETPTGNEEMDVTTGGVIYLSSDQSAATKYSKNGGAVYEVLVADPVLYAEQREKQSLPPKANEFLRNVFVALPNDVEIRQKLDIQEVAPLTRKERKRLKK